MIMNKLLSLQVLERPIIELLETILSARGELTFLPFYLTDPFSSFESDDECKSYTGFIDHGYRCNLLANQGVSIAGLFVLLFVCAFITGVVVVALKLMKKYEARRLNKPRGLSEIAGITEKRNIEETRLWKILSLVRNRLGLQYWVIKISGMQLELVIFSLLSIRTVYWSFFSIAGLYISMIMLGLFSIFIVSAYFNSRWYWKQLLKRKSTHLPLNNPSNIKGEPINMKIDLNKCTVPLLSFHFDNVSDICQLRYLMMPVIMQIKNIILGVVLVWVIGVAWQQISVAIVVQGCYIVIFASSRRSMSLIEFIFVMADESIYLAFLVFKLMTTIVLIPEDFRQKKLGLMMYIAVNLELAVGMCYMLVVCLITIIDVWKEFRKRFINRTKIISAIIKTSSTSSNLTTKPREFQLMPRIIKRSRNLSFNDETKNELPRTILNRDITFQTNLDQFDRKLRSSVDVNHDYLKNERLKVPVSPKDQSLIQDLNRKKT